MEQNERSQAETADSWGVRRVAPERSNDAVHFRQEDIERRRVDSS